MYLSANSAFSRETIVLSCGNIAPPFIIESFKEQYKQAFDKLGYDLFILLQPPKRALHSANSGETDGECARSKQPKDNPNLINLIRVDTPVAVNFNLGLWEYKKDKKIFSDITKNVPEEGSAIGVVMGGVISDKTLKKWGIQGHTYVRNINTGLKMLYSGRLDYLIASDVFIYYELKNLNLDVKIHKVKDLVSMDVYPWLHKRNKYLVEPLAKTLSESQPLDLEAYLIEKMKELKPNNTNEQFPNNR